jgi:hypothetical protein
MRRALADQQLLGGVMVGDSWAVWRALLIAIMGEPLTDTERVLYRSVTGRPQEPRERVEEFWCIAGRRSGKNVGWVSVGIDHDCQSAFKFDPVSASNFGSDRAARSFSG